MLRLPFIRGIVALGDSLAIGFRALGLSAQWAASDDDSDEVTEELSRWSIVVAFVFAIGFSLVLFKASPALLADLFGLDGVVFALVEGADPRQHPGRLPRAAVADPRPEARVPVPRRRAHGHQRARGRRRADARLGRQALAASTSAAAPRSCSG